MLSMQLRPDDLTRYLVTNCPEHKQSTQRLSRLPQRTLLEMVGEQALKVGLVQVITGDGNWRGDYQNSKEDVERLEGKDP
jgi:hypothetical protein